MYTVASAGTTRIIMNQVNNLVAFTIFDKKFLKKELELLGFKIRGFQLF